MKVLAHLLAGTLLFLLSVSGAGAQTPWFTDFNAGPLNSQPSAPWENVRACSMVNAGYFGTIGVQGMAGGTSPLGRMYRAAGGTTAYVVWKVYLGWEGSGGYVAVGLAPIKTTEDYGIGNIGTQLIAYQAGSDTVDYTVLMVTYASDGTENPYDRAYAPSLPRGWYEFKLEAVGLDVSSYYREPGAGTWILIGTRTQEFGYAPNYVGVALGYRGFVDDIGFNAESYPTGSLKSHVTLQDYAPVTACPVAVGVQLTKSGVPMDPVKAILDANGELVITDVPAGTYEAAYTAAGFLRSVISSVVIIGGQEKVQPVTMINGDFNGDGHLTSADLSGILTNIDLKGN